MRISELIERLDALKKEHGDINVCVGESHEYWGRVETYITEHNITVEEHAQPQGVKSGKSEKAVLFCY